MAHYLMTVHGPAEMDEHGGYPSQEVMDEAISTTEAFNDRLRADGNWVFAGGLRSGSAAAVVDGQAASPVVTDGPYLESKELLAGFWIIDAPSREVALDLAAQASRACRAPVELRPFDDLSGGPAA